MLSSKSTVEYTEEPGAEIHHVLAILPQPLEYVAILLELSKATTVSHLPFKFVLVNNKTGLRTCIENNEQLFTTRANEMDSFNKYLFFCLNRIYSDYKICDIYPHYARNMYMMKNIYEFMIDNLHQTYVDYFIQKKTIELNEPFKKYLIDIHKTYYIPTINSLQRTLITRKIVKDYFNKISPFELHKLFESL